MSSAEEQIKRIQSLVEAVQSQFGDQGITPDSDKLIAALRSLINSEAAMLSTDAQRIIIDALNKARDNQRSDAKSKSDQERYYKDIQESEANAAKDRLNDIEKEKRARVNAAVDVADALGYAATNFFGLFDEGIARIASNLSNAISGAISGFSQGGVAGIAGAIGSILSGFASLFSGGADKIVVSQYELIEAIENWESTIETLTPKEKTAQQEMAELGIEAASRLMGNGWDWNQIVALLRPLFESVGLSIPQGITYEQFLGWGNDIIADIGASNAQTTAELKADNAASRRELVLSQKTGTDALETIADLDKLYALSPEELHALYEETMAKFGDKMSDSDRINTQALINDYHRGEAERAQSGAGAEQTQASRSIQKITERQVDSLISALSTIDLHITEGIQKLLDGIRNTTNRTTMNAAATIEVAVINAGVINTGSIRVAGSMSGNNGASANTKQLLTVESRSLGRRV